MSAMRLIAIVLLVTMSAVLVQPARAEALEGTAVLALVGIGIAVLIIVVVVVIANVREGQRGAAVAPTPLLLAEAL